VRREEEPASDDREHERARSRLAEAGVVVLHEDNHLLVVSKPAGLASQGGPGIDEHLVSLLERYRREAERKPGRAYVGLVHRLDRNVSGVLVVARTSKAAGRLSALFRERTTALRKIYVAYVHGRVAEREGTLVHRLVREGLVTREAAPDDPRGREARLAWTLEARGEDVSRLRVELETGLPHQIRAQLAIWGHPIVGDAKYGGSGFPRPALHAARLVFPHPVGGAEIDVEAPLPDDLRRLDERVAQGR